MSAIIGASRLAYRLLGKRMRVMSRPLLQLETVGAKSGKTRTAILGWFPDTSDENWLVLASYAGSSRHPAWFFNLAERPDRVWVEVGGRRYQVQPESLQGTERARRGSGSLHHRQATATTKRRRIVRFPSFG